MKKALGETQTLRAGCKTEPKVFAPPANPLLGGAGRTKFNQLEMVTIQTQFGEDRCTQFRVIVLTDPHTQTHTHTRTHTQRDRTDYNTLRR